MGESKSTQQESIPEWQTKFLQGTAMPIAQNIADTPFSRYGGQYAPQMGEYGQQAGAAYGAAAGMTPQDYAAQTQANFNPYQQQVIDASLAQMNRQGDIARTGLEGSMIGAGAFGSRGEVARGEFEAGLQGQRDAMIANMMQQGYGQAQGVTQQQIANRMAGAGGLMGAAGMQQGLQQGQMAGDYGEFLREQGYPAQQLQGVLGLGGGDYGRTTTQTQKPGLLDYLAAGAQVASMW